MPHRNIFAIKSAQDFEENVLAIFKYQFENNLVYRSFCDLLYVHPSGVKHYSKIPFLPIEFFKTHEVFVADKKPGITFTSSGTTGSILSKHHVCDPKVYEKSFTESFNMHYGNVTDYAVLALLPSYLERTESSLVYMVGHLITASKHKDSGFYLNDYFALSEKLKALDNAGKKVLLIGVSFALLDLIENETFSLKNTIVMETGGMKGRRKEIIREELHDILKKGFGVSNIHSEYGMTELLSQAYSSGKGVFTTPPWMKVLIRDTEDPFQYVASGNTGGINIIDLANTYSCPFIATQDLGKVNQDGTFTVLGRFDNSDIRGCNLMAL